MLSRREVALAALAVAATGGSGASYWRERQALAAFDPELRDFVARYLANPPPDLSPENLAMFRQVERATAPPPLPSPAVKRSQVPGLNGAPPVGVRLINARPGTARPAIFYLHGGGFVMGDAAGAVRQLQGLAAALDCVAVAVDYRRAPETRHDGMLDDVSAALRWVHDQTARIGVDPARIAIMGSSAGGGLAALLAMRARDEGVVRPCLQLLVYPMLDDRTGAAPSSAPSLWSAANNRFGWAAFLGDRPANAVSARRSDLAGLPPTLIAVGSLDLFHDEDVAFAKRLASAGVATKLKVTPGAFHGFDLAVPGSRAAKRFRADIIAALATAFGTEKQIRD